jgi:hypothetical protein
LGFAQVAGDFPGLGAPATLHRLKCPALSVLEDAGELDATPTLDDERQPMAFEHGF